MRQSILFFTCAMIAVIGFPVPRIALFGWVWFGLMRPDVMAYAYGRYNYSLWMAVPLVAGCLRYLKNAPAGWIRNPMSRQLVLMLALLFLSTLLAPLPQDAEIPFGLFLRMTIATLMIPLVITDLRSLQQLYLVTAVSLGLHGLWRGTFGLLSGGFRMYAGIGGFMSDNNTFACGLTMVLPFMWYSRSLVKARWARMLLLWMTFGSMSTIVWSFSRGAAIGLAALLIVFVLQSRHKIAAFALIVGVGLAPVVFLVRDRYLGRMATAVEYEGDNAVLSRLELMRIAPQVWAMRPWFGVGLGERNFYLYSEKLLPTELGRNLIVHNSFLQMLAHGGIFAFIVFNYMLFGTLWRVTRSARQMRKQRPELEAYPRAIQLSLIAYAVCSLTQPRATFDLFYMIIGYAAAWHVISRSLPAAEPKPAAAVVEVASRPMAIPMRTFSPAVSAVSPLPIKAGPRI